MSLVPIVSLGNRYGVSVRGMESLICMACIAHSTDYWSRGRTVESLGIGHLSVGELTRYVTGKLKHPIPMYTRRPKLSSISVTRIERPRNINGHSLSDNSNPPAEITNVSETMTPN
jgi:hypothetical protein